MQTPNIIVLRDLPKATQEWSFFDLWGSLRPSTPELPPVLSGLSSEETSTYKSLLKVFEKRSANFWWRSPAEVIQYDILYITDLEPWRHLVVWRQLNCLDAVSLLGLMAYLVSTPQGTQCSCEDVLIIDEFPYESLHGPTKNPASHITPRISLMSSWTSNPGCHCKHDQFRVPPDSPIGRSGKPGARRAPWIHGIPRYLNDPGDPWTRDRSDREVLRIVKNTDRRWNDIACNGGYFITRTLTRGGKPVAGSSPSGAQHIFPGVGSFTSSFIQTYRRSQWYPRQTHSWLTPIILVLFGATNVQATETVDINFNQQSRQANATNVSSWYPWLFVLCYFCLSAGFAGAGIWQKAQKTFQAGAMAAYAVAYLTMVGAGGVPVVVSWGAWIFCALHTACFAWLDAVELDAGQGHVFIVLLTAIFIDVMAAAGNERFSALLPSIALSLFACGWIRAWYQSYRISWRQSLLPFHNDGGQRRETSPSVLQEQPRTNTNRHSTSPTQNTSYAQRRFAGQTNPVSPAQ